MPVEAKVAASLRPINPALPIPQMIKQPRSAAMRSAANANSSSIDPETCVRAEALCWMMEIPRAMRSLRDTAEFDCFLEADDPIAIGKSMPCVVNESLFDNEHGRIPFLGPRANLEPALLAIAILWVREAASGGRGCSTARLLYCGVYLLGFRDDFPLGAPRLPVALLAPPRPAAGFPRLLRPLVGLPERG